ncbi:unnamed protein product [Periconia digitata]|uniref:Transcription factor TFIIIC triple barrel domain-containing protein n=1 Tax=Periconia digitata TaxID=1303443 RepID=A0A9W4UEY7_9PLEO|nr:unnamed protein product [Periconia digitata]
MAMAPSEEDEWEYEYDEEETEDFYIPIDLSNVPELQAPTTEPKQRLGHPWLLKTKLRAFYANRKGAANLQARTSINNPENPENHDSMGEMQLIGLHTPNPLIMYNGQLLSCHWASAIGTDFLFTKPDSVVGDEERPLRNLPDVDLIGTSSARLVARVGQLRPKDEALERMSSTRQDEQTSELRVSDSSAPDEIADEQHDAAMAGGTGEASAPAPSTFLERLNAAKSKRGDKSRLMVSTSTGQPHLVAQSVVANPNSDDTVMEDA